MENFVKEFDREYKSIVGEYNVEMASGVIPVHFHGSQVLEEFSLAWYHLMSKIEEFEQEDITFL